MLWIALVMAVVDEEAVRSRAGCDSTMPFTPHTRTSDTGRKTRVAFRRDAGMQVQMRGGNQRGPCWQDQIEIETEIALDETEDYSATLITEQLLLDGAFLETDSTGTSNQLGAPTRPRRVSRLGKIALGPRHFQSASFLDP